MFFKWLRSEKGVSNIIFMVSLMPILAVIIYGGVQFGNMAGVSNVTEEAARAGARWLAAHPGDVFTARQKAADVVSGSFTKATAATTFDPNVDITFDVTGGYVTCKVLYHYPVPLRNIFTLVKGGQEPASRGLTGKAAFKEGESGL